MSESKQNRVRLQVVVKPESKDRLKEMCAEYETSEGRMIDALILKLPLEGCKVSNEERRKKRRAICVANRQERAAKRRALNANK